MKLQDQIKSYLEGMGNKYASKAFGVSPQQVGAWKRKPETVPFKVVEAMAAHVAEMDVRLNTSGDLTEGTAEPPTASPQSFYEKDVTTPHPDNQNDSMAASVLQDHEDKLYDLNERTEKTQSDVAQILALLQGGAGQQQPVRISPAATTQRLNPQADPQTGELPAFVSAGPVQSATDNLTRPSRFSGRAISEADLDRMDPTRHNPPVDPADLPAKHWMRPKDYSKRGR